MVNGRETSLKEICFQLTHNYFIGFFRTIFGFIVYAVSAIQRLRSILLIITFLSHLQPCLDTAVVVSRHRRQEKVLCNIT